MIWGEKDFESSRLSNLQALSQSSHLLGFNEPNFNAQVRTEAEIGSSPFPKILSPLAMAHRLHSPGGSPFRLPHLLAFNVGLGAIPSVLCHANGLVCLRAFFSLHGLLCFLLRRRPLCHACDLLDVKTLIDCSTQADLTPAAAAELWADVKSAASDLGAAIVSPAVNFCAGDCNEEVGREHNNDMMIQLPVNR